MNRINVICLGVRDMEKSIRFYKDGLGFQTKETNYSPPVIFFSASGGTKLELYPLNLLAEDIGKEAPPAIGRGFGGITLAYNVKSREEVHEVVGLAKRAGAKIEKEPQEVFWGGYHAYFSDPDGYYWEVAYGPDFQFDENDMLVLE
jgi:catechol 2,3-dioxygenase-like lactoylglutathione lyase family enzyme